MDVWGFLWIMVVLKIPLLGLLALVWYAVRAQPDLDEDAAEDDGGTRRPRHPPRRPRRRPRGPHGDDAIRPPAPRVRTAARARQALSDR